MDIKIEPDHGNPNPFRRKIRHTTPIPNTRSGKVVTLECGHVVQTFGRLELAPDDGVICTACRDEAQRR